MVAEADGPEQDLEAAAPLDGSLLDGFPRLDKSQVRVRSLSDDADTRAYWHSRTPEERLGHVEYLRRVNYGHQATARLQRVLEVVEGPRR